MGAVVIPLVVHGGRDAITPVENGTMLLDRLDTSVDTLIRGDSSHYPAYA